MPLFMPDEELARLSSDAASVVAERADEIYAELDSVSAKADAASITAEQTCSLLQKLSLSQDFSSLESQKHQLHLQSIEKDGEVEKMTTEMSQLPKSKRQLMELLEQKDAEISEKNCTIKSYLDKIVKLTDACSEMEARLAEASAELACSQAMCSRLSQEKELRERHAKWLYVKWLYEELTAKVHSYAELRRRHSDLEDEMSAELVDFLNRLDEELTTKVDSYTELHRRHSDLEAEMSPKLVDENEDESEIEKTRKANELNLIPFSSFTGPGDNSGPINMIEESQEVISRVPAGVSGAAHHLAKIYEKYQEAVDALRHEQLGRKEAEMILQRVLSEVEEKARLIQEERGEYDRLVEAYSLFNQKLQDSVFEQSNMEKLIMELKSDLRRRERENTLFQKDISDLQKQVTILLKEYRDVQL